MTPFTVLTGVAAPLPLDNVDTDMILPGRFLKTIGRAGLGAALFADMRHDSTGAPRADFVLEKPGYAQARILVAGINFGCGSSREHAPWALLDYGIGCVVAEGFADIFFGNAINCGLLPAAVTAADLAHLHAAMATGPVVLTVDLTARAVMLPDGAAVPFMIPDAARARLLRGLDMVAETLEEEAAIQAFEARRGSVLSRAPETMPQDSAL